MFKLFSGAQSLHSSNLQSPNLHSPNLHSPNLHSPNLQSPNPYLYLELSESELKQIGLAAKSLVPDPNEEWEKELAKELQVLTTCDVSLNSQTGY